MATYQKSFDAYKIYHYASSTTQTPIHVYCYSGTSRVGYLGFYRDEGASLPNRYDSSQGITLFYPVSQFNNVITTLREEKPLFMFVNDEGFGYFATSEYEATGEGEAAA